MASDNPKIQKGFIWTHTEHFLVTGQLHTLTTAHPPQLTPLTTAHPDNCTPYQLHTLTTAHPTKCTPYQLHTLQTAHLDNWPHWQLHTLPTAHPTNCTPYQLTPLTTAHPDTHTRASSISKTPNVVLLQQNTPTNKTAQKTENLTFRPLPVKFLGRKKYWTVKKLCWSF